METNSRNKKTLNAKESLPIIFILMISAFLNIFMVWAQGFANKYYAAGVYSMGQNLHAFFFNSFDSIGFVTIDKPPLGFWIQVLSTKIFGFSGFALVLPQAIAS
ncbi:MAG: glycosyltransferase family 39 protein, partial [Eubacteriales bacterium]